MKRTLFALLLIVAMPALAAEGEHAAEAGNSQMMWKWINFGLLAVFLVWLWRKVAAPYFTARAAAIQQDLREAAALKADAEKRAAEIDRKIGNLAGEVESFKRKSSADMAAESVRIEGDTRLKLAKVAADAQRDIASAAAEAKSSLRAESAKLALDLARQKVAARMTPQTDASLVAGFVEDLKKVKS